MLSSQSGLANVTIATGANILALHPASVYAGAANGFTLRVDGGNFAASTPGPGSVLLIAGTCIHLFMNWLLNAAPYRGTIGTLASGFTFTKLLRARCI